MGSCARFCCTFNVRLVFIAQLVSMVIAAYSCNTYISAGLLQLDAPFINYIFGIAILCEGIRLCDATFSYFKWALAVCKAFPLCFEVEDKKTGKKR